jgi:hypothetical protein
LWLWWVWVTSVCRWLSSSASGSRTIGYDLSASKVAHYRQHVDPTGEVSSADLKAAVHLEVGTDAAALSRGGFRDCGRADARRSRRISRISDR